MTDLWQWLAELAWWVRLIVSIAAFIGGALTTGWLVHLTTSLAGRNVSARTIAWSRLGGGVISGVLIWLFLQIGPPGAGFGTGDHKTGTGSDRQEHPPGREMPTVTAPSSFVPVAPAKQTTIPKGTLLLRVKLLGPSSDPPFAAPDKYFLVLGIAPLGSEKSSMVLPMDWPRAPINAEGVLALVDQIRHESQLEAVELHVTPFSTSLRHDAVGNLRRLLLEAKVRFEYPPDPDRPLYSKLVER